jgi:hypothetical protein
MKRYAYRLYTPKNRGNILMFTSDNIYDNPRRAKSAGVKHANIFECFVNCTVVDEELKEVDFYYYDYEA